MERWRHIISIFLVLSTCFCASAQKPIGVVYYDVDRLYDTIPSLFYNDQDYTPSGRYGWNTERYRRKITNTAAVIDSMALPIVGLWGVENEVVVRDIVTQSKGDYSYLHRTLNALDGMDFALLYYGDLFFVHRVEEGRRYLYIEGELRGTKVGIVLCSDPRMTEWVVRDLRVEDPQLKLIVMGRSGVLNPTINRLSDTHAHAAGQGLGNIRRLNRWEMRDRIWVDTTLKFDTGNVFIRRFLLDKSTAYPIKTIENRKYIGGYGYALPIYTYIR